MDGLFRPFTGGRAGREYQSPRVNRGGMASCDDDNHHDDDNPNGLFFLTPVVFAKVSSHVCYIQLQIFFFERHT